MKRLEKIIERAQDFMEMSFKTDDEIFAFFKDEYAKAVKLKLPPNPYMAAFTMTCAIMRVRKAELDKILKDHNFKD